MHENSHIAVHHTTTYGALIMWMEVALVHCFGELSLPFPQLKSIPLINFAKADTPNKCYKKLFETVMSETTIPLRMKWAEPFFRYKLRQAAKDLWQNYHILQYLRFDLPASELTHIKAAFLDVTGGFHREYSRCPKQVKQINNVWGRYATTIDDFSCDKSESFMANKSPFICTVAGNMAWEEYSIVEAVAPDYFDPDRTSPMLPYNGKRVPLTGMALAEGLGMLTTCISLLIQGGSISEVFSFLEDDIYYVGVDFINSAAGLPTMDQIDPAKITLENFWSYFGIAISSIYSALSIPLLPHTLTANELRVVGKFWSFGPQDIHPGWRLVRFGRFLRNEFMNDIIKERTTNSIEKQMNWYRHLVDFIPKIHGYSTPSALWFAWGSTTFGPMVKGFRYPGAQRQEPVMDEQYIRSYLDPLNTLLATAVAPDNVKHWVCQDSFKMRNPEDDYEGTDLLFDAILRRYVFSHLDESSPLEEHINDYIHRAREAADPRSRKTDADHKH